MVNAYQACSGGASKTNANGTIALHPKLEPMVRQSFKVGKLSLVDLAGSERVRLSGATGQRLEESKKINQSLSALGNVIAALTDARGQQHIPYRDSKLTRILEDSLGGNCKTTTMAMISPALEAITESLSTLKLANRAKSTKNEARVSEDLDQKSLLRKYERELKRLCAELEEKSRNVVDKRRLLELDEQRRCAEEDKMAAIRALEERSREFVKEKEEKKKLEQRISMLTSQMLMSNQRRHPGGNNCMRPGGMGEEELDAEDPIIRDAIEEHQDRIRKEYECRLADLEKERESIEEEKAQVDRYKQLLLKQRDIMIALTQRLNERDEQITALQDELDAYDRHQKELEEKLDEKTAHLIHLQRVTMEHNANSSGKTPAEIIQALGDWGNSTSSNSRGAGRGARDSQGVSSGNPLRAELLITHKQFRPHPIDQIVYNNNINAASSSNNNAGAGPNDQQLLSAEEKINELKSLVETQSQEHLRMAKELKEVKSEKMSIEFVLREHVEKLVQVELEARTKIQQQQQQRAGKRHHHGESSSNNSDLTAAAALDATLVVQLQKQLKDLEAENERLKCGSSTSGNALEATQSDEQTKQLYARCDVLVKERKAVQTIMEHKIKALVNAISEASDATLQSAGGVVQLGEPAKRLTREVNALQWFVNASIIALRNAESGTANTAAANASGPAGIPQSATTATAPAKLSTDSSKSTTPSSSHVRASSPTRSSGSQFNAGPSHAPSTTATASVSVEELIQQRRAQLQRERQESS
ncbi:Kinesin-like protein, partial [Globisporangium splendens]